MTSTEVEAKIGALMTTDWSPEQYHRFQDERSRPFWDLLGGVAPIPGGRALDLGCGTGELTRALHEKLELAETLGVDRSDAMLAASAEHSGNGLRFEKADLADFEPSAAVDLVFSNAALHWLPDHPGLWTRIAGWLAPGGQLAIQIPANFDHASHRVAAEVASQEPFRTELQGFVRRAPVLVPEEYSALLWSLGFRAPVVRLEVYPHELEGPESVLEWVRGTLLTAYQKRLSEDGFAGYLERYRERLLTTLEDHRPFFYPFKRILMWTRR